MRERRKTWSTCNFCHTMWKQYCLLIFGHDHIIFNLLYLIPDEMKVQDIHESHCTLYEERWPNLNTAMYPDQWKMTQKIWFIFSIAAKYTFNNRINMSHLKCDNDFRRRRCSSHRCMTSLCKERTRILPTDFPGKTDKGGGSIAKC